MGFGGEAQLALWTPVLVAAGIKVAEFLYQVATSAASAVLKDRILAWLEGGPAPGLPKDIEARLTALLDEELGVRYPGLDTSEVVATIIASLKG